MLILYTTGYGTGARYDGSFNGNAYIGSCEGKSDIGSWDQTMRDETRQFIEAQMDAFEATTQGWTWWTMRTEGAGEWDLFALLDAGLYPNPVTSRNFPPACGSYS
jgi:glucan 1,3-beta-glucosidase